MIRYYYSEIGKFIFEYLEDTTGKMLIGQKLYRHNLKMTLGKMLESLLKIV